MGITTGRKYANPPLVEAVCELRLTSDTPWDLTVPGLLYEKLKSSFPRKRQRLVQEVEVAREPALLQHQIHTIEHLLCLTEDEKMILQVGPWLVRVHALRPYPHWEGFKPFIAMVWNGLQEIIDSREIDRIGLRYHNHIELTESKVKLVELNEYLDFYPFMGPNLPRYMTTFLLGVEFSYANDRDRCRVQLAPTRDQGGKLLLMLDIDYFLARPRAIKLADGLNWIEEAHTRVEELFEGCITDNLRKMFQEIK